MGMRPYGVLWTKESSFKVDGTKENYPSLEETISEKVNPSLNKWVEQNPNYDFVWDDDVTEGFKSSKGIIEDAEDFKEKFPLEIGIETKEYEMIFTIKGASFHIWED